jgi:hypothetical protein
MEDPSVSDPKERERLFGQWDHVRKYSPDFAERLTEAGSPSCYSAGEIAGTERSRLAIRQDESPLSYCRRDA